MPDVLIEDTAAVVVAQPRAAVCRNIHVHVREPGPQTREKIRKSEGQGLGDRGGRGRGTREADMIEDKSFFCCCCWVNVQYDTPLTGLGDMGKGV